jgi:hypothetical protein
VESFVVVILRVDFREGRDSLRVLMKASMAASSEGVALSAGSYGIESVVRKKQERGVAGST